MCYCTNTSDSSEKYSLRNYLAVHDYLYKTAKLWKVFGPKKAKRWEVKDGSQEMAVMANNVNNTISGELYTFHSLGT